MLLIIKIKSESGSVPFFKQLFLVNTAECITITPMPVWVGRLLSLLTAILMLAVFAIAAMPNGHAFLGNHSQWIFQKDYLSGAGFYLSYHPRKYTRMDFEMYLPRTYVPFALLMGIAIIPGIAGIICEDKDWIRKAPVQIKPGFMRCATFIARLVFCLSIWLWFIPFILFFASFPWPADKIAAWVWIGTLPTIAIMGAFVPSSLVRQRRVVERAYWILVANICVFGFLGIMQ
jgi:hypothetical protein